MTVEKVALGEKLYFDKGSLPTARPVAPPATTRTGASRPARSAEGIGGKKGARATPRRCSTRMFNARQFWDGRAATLEDQAKLPILNPIEMGMPSTTRWWQRCARSPSTCRVPPRLRPRASTTTTMASAIAAFERTLISGDAPFDRFIAGDTKGDLRGGEARLGAVQRQGALQRLPRREPSSPLFTDKKFHNIGVAAHKTRTSPLPGARARQVISQPEDQAQIDELALQTEASRSSGASWSPGSRTTSARSRRRGCAQHRHHGAVHARRLGDDAVGRHGPLQQGRRGEPVPRRRHAAAGLTEPEIDDVVDFMLTLTDDDARRKSSKVAANARSTRSECGSRRSVATTKPRRPSARPAVKNPARRATAPSHPRSHASHQERRDAAGIHARTRRVLRDEAGHRCRAATS